MQKKQTPEKNELTLFHPDSELLTRIRTAMVEALILIVFIVPGRWIPFMPVILVAFITFMMAFEKVKAVNIRMPGVNLILVSVLSVVIGLFAYAGILKESFVRGLPLQLAKTVNTALALRIIGTYALPVVVLLPLLGLYRLWRKGPEELPMSVSDAWIIFSSSLLLGSSIALLYGYPVGWHWFVLALLTTAASDTASYFAGKAFGRRKMVPNLSPKKTWEGTLAGIAATVVLHLIFVPLFIGRRIGFSTPGSLIFALIAAVLMSAVSTAGDLVNSAVKRWCGIKDFGNLLPGHGGVSDRFDSLSTVVPTMFAVATLAQLLA